MLNLSFINRDLNAIRLNTARGHNEMFRTKALHWKNLNLSREKYKCVLTILASKMNGFGRDSARSTVAVSQTEL